MEPETTAVPARAKSEFRGWRAAHLANRPGVVPWLTVIGLGAALLIAGVWWPPLARPFWVSPLGLFWIVVPAASLCWCGGLVALLIGWRDDLAEVAILGAAICVQSVLALVHGLTSPGVLFGPTHVSRPQSWLPTRWPWRRHRRCSCLVCGSPSGRRVMSASGPGLGWSAPPQSPHGSSSHRMPWPRVPAGASLPSW